MKTNERIVKKKKEEKPSKRNSQKKETSCNERLHSKIKYDIN